MCGNYLKIFNVTNPTFTQIINLLFITGVKINIIIIILHFISINLHLQYMCKHKKHNNLFEISRQTKKTSCKNHLFHDFLMSEIHYFI